jgi:signal peptidase I
MTQREVLHPSSAAPPEPAAFKIRLQAGLIDEILLGVISTILSLQAYAYIIGPSSSLTAAAALLAAIIPARVAFRAAFVAKTGRTPGKQWMGIIVHGPDAQIPSVGRAIKRALSAEILIILRPLIIGWGDPFMIRFREDCRAGHDLIADTRVMHMPDARKQPSWAIIALLVIPWALANAIGLPLHVQRANSDSMAPTIRAGDYLLVASVGPYATADAVTVGDIVLHLPPEHIGLPDRLFVNRIVASGVDSVRIEDGKLYRNGEPVEEPYIAEPMEYTWPPEEAALPEDAEVTDEGAVEVPPNHFFVLGDNRNDSNDSHRWQEKVDGEWVLQPFLPANNVRGRASAIVWPPSRMKVLQ